MIEHIRHVGIVVSDLEESLRFYTQKMGFVVSKRMDESGSFIDKILGFENLKVTTLKMTLNEGQMIELLDLKSHKTKPVPRSINNISPTHIAFTISNADDTYEEFSNVVYSKSFLEHLKESHMFLKEALRILKPGRSHFISCVWLGSQYKKFYDDHTHRSHFTSVSLKNMQLVTGFQDVKVYKFRQLPVTTQYPLVNYFYAFISLFIPMRTTVSFLRWSRELILIGEGRKPFMADGS